MRLGIRGKLFVVPLLLFLAVIVAAGPYLEHRLRGYLLSRIEEELLHHAQSARQLVDSAPGLDLATLDPIAELMGEATGARVTVIRDDGEVWADSKLPIEEVAEMENHGNRPEVIAALAGGTGIERRYSTTIGSEMLYVALPFERPDGRGVVRVAKPLSEIDEAESTLRGILLFAGLFGLLAAILVAALASHFMSRAFRSLADTARAVAEGNPSRRVEVRSHDELGIVAGSLNQMAAEIERTVSALAGERARFKAVLEGMSGAVVALDGDKRVTLMNPSARELLGVEEQYEGRLLAELIRVPALLALVGGESHGGGSAEFEIPLAERRVMARITPQLDRRGSVLVMHDITALRRLETIRRDFVANVSHELRTPVSVIRANAETLLEGALADEKHGPKLAEAVFRNAERLTDIINDLLELSRLEAGRRNLECTPVSLNEAVRRAIDYVDKPAQRAAIDIAVDVAADTAVMADSTALEQVLINLLDNAVKHTGEGSKVTIRAVGREAVLRIEIEDDGPGIEPTHRSRVFERFYRVDPGRSREMGGTGLGLSIVKHMVDAMGGEIGVDPASPCGCVFWLELPGVEAEPSPPPAA